MSNDLLEGALLCAACGMPVFPLIPRDKRPAHSGWQAEATTDPEQIRAWWAENPSYNVGVKTGGGICVMDVDDKPEKHGGLLGSDFLSDWESEHGRISETVCCKTPTGGMHYYFDVGDTRIDGCQSDTIFIDLRCDGNLIVAPPSIHPDTGTAYEWDISPEDMAPAKASTIDKACIQWVHENRKGDSGDEHGKFKAPDVVHEGEGRDNTLYKMACSMWAQNLPESTILAALTDYNAKCCKPPLPKRIVKQKLNSAMGKPPGLSEAAKKTKKDKGGTSKFDHAGIARKLMDENGACLVDGIPAIRDGKRYAVGWNAVDREIIKIEPTATRANEKEVHHYLTVMADNVQQASPNLIAFRNGVLDIETYELRDFRDDDVILNIIPHDWVPDAECREVDAVLMKMACGQLDVYQSLIEVIGVCMYRSAEFTQAAILLGRGSNGKSTYIRMLQATLGKENVSSLDMAMIGKQFHTGQLAGKLANLGDDISNEFQHGDMLSVFKKLVDGNRMYCDVKGTEGFEFESYATLVFSANEFPRLADYSEGMMRRIFPIEFNATFSKDDDDYDPRISQKVTSEKACQRLCVLGMVGLSSVMGSNGFTPNAASERRVGEIRSDNDTVLAWMQENGWDAESLDGGSVPTLYRSYRDWCDDSGLQAVKRTKFSRSVNMHTGLEAKPAWCDGKTVRCFSKA